MSLPEIVKREILFPKLNDKEHGISERKKVTARIVSMFQIKFESSEAQGLAIAEYGSFLRDYTLTSEEVLEAYRMVAKLQLLDHKGEPIKFYPNLSIGQAGEILKSYQDFKADNALHTKGYAQIKAFLTPPEQILTYEEKRAQRRRLRSDIEKRFFEFGSCEYAFFIYEDLKADGVLEELLKPEIIEPLKNKLMSKFLSKEITRNLFYKKLELRELSNNFRENKKYKIPALVIQEIKNAIVEKYLENKYTKNQSIKN